MEEKLFDAEFWNRLHRIRLAEGQRMSGGRSGGRRSMAKGSSVEFADFREYIPGDDIRRIDWNAYGRMDRLYVKLFMQEQEGIYTIVTDTSASMNFGSPSKAVMASRLAGALGYMALHGQDRVRLASVYSSVPSGKRAKVESGKALQADGKSGSGGIVTDGKFDYRDALPQAKVEAGLTGMQSLNRYLAQIERLSFQGQTDLWDSIRKISFPRRGCTVILSDFMDRGAEPSQMENIAQVLKYLRFQKQDIVLIRIVAEEEQHPVFQGTVNLVDEETEEELKVTMTEKLLSEYGKQVEKYCMELQKLAKRYQAPWMEVMNTETIDQVIYKGLHNGSLQSL